MATRHMLQPVMPSDPGSTCPSGGWRQISLLSSQAAMSALQHRFCASGSAILCRLCMSQKIRRVSKGYYKEMLMQSQALIREVEA